MLVNDTLRFLMLSRRFKLGWVDEEKVARQENFRLFVSLPIRKEKPFTKPAGGEWANLGRATG